MGAHDRGRRDAMRTPRWAPDTPTVDRRGARRPTTVERDVGMRDPRRRAAASAPDGHPARGGRGQGPTAAARLVATLGMALAVGVLLGVLLVLRAPNRPLAAANGTTPARRATATPAGPAWVAVPGLSSASGAALLASDPHVAYVARIAQGKGAPPTLTFRRSDDAGATWRDLALPVQGLDLANTQVALFPSPLGAHTVILEVDTNVGPGPCPPGFDGGPGIGGVVRAGGGTPGGRAAAGVAARSSTACAGQFLSADGGDHWAAVALPGSGLLGRTADGDPQSEPLLRAQAGRLYAMLGAALQGQDSTATSGRLVVSVDGGATWAYADAALPSDVAIADFAPAPAGTTVFAITDRADRFGQPVQNLPPPDLRLWRSDDAGAQWTPVGALPFQGVDGVRVTTAAGGSPVLYASTPTGDGGAADTLMASANGGTTWAAAPTRGVPAGQSAQHGIWATLPNGAVLMAYLDTPGHLTLASWRSGETSWRPIGRTVARVGQLVQVQTAPGGGSPTVWMLYGTDGGWDTAHVDLPPA